MTKKGKFFTVLLMFIFCFVLLIGCSKTEEDDATADEALNSDSNTTLNNSIITLPKSVSSKQSKKRADDSSNCSGMLCIYAGIPMYIGMAEMMGDFTKELMGHIVTSGLLANVPIGKIVSVPVDAADPDSPTGIMVQKENIQISGDTAAETYWKVSLYFDVVNETPELIVRFRFNADETAAKGRILWKMVENDEFDVLSADIEITRSIDIIFDGGVSSTTKSLEIKLVQDLSNHFAYAQTYWSIMTDAQKDDLDISQPGKVFVNASYNGSEYTIYGTSYHPGWAKEATLKNDDTMWGTGRSMYMFQAKANSTGAKLYLALPVETTTDVTNVWTTDSVGNIFTTMMLTQLNTMIAKLKDSVDDPDNDGSGGSNLSVSQEQAQGAAILAFLVDNGDGTISKTELEAYLNATGNTGFAAQYYAIKYMINPVFFSEANGFLGTYDETADKFYGLNVTTVGEITKPAEFTAINVLDLSSIVPYIPANVVAATITVE